MGIFIGISPIPPDSLPDPNVYEGFSAINAVAFQFTLPGTVTLTEAYSESESIKFDFIRVSHFTQNPFYKMPGRPAILGNTLGHVLDIYPEQSEATFVQATVHEKYHPEFYFNLNDDGLEVKDSDLSNERALYGDTYLPSKIRVAKALREVILKHQLDFTVQHSDFTADSFSCFRALYIKYPSKSIIIERVYYFTSTPLYKEFTTKYTKKLNEVGFLTNDFYHKLNSISIDSNSDLKSFVKLIFDDVVINSINHKSGYKYFWRDEKCISDPKNEPDVQPYLLNLIETLCESKGISVVREPVSSEGEIDMLFTYTNSQGRLLKICAEVKKAHHDQIESAVGTQLKRYLDSQRTKFGIYIALWFKYPNKKNIVRFNKPTKFDTMNELFSAIELNKPAGYQIDTIIIDCTKSKSPSIK